MIKFQPQFQPSEATYAKTNLSSSFLYSKDRKRSSGVSSESCTASVLSVLLQVPLFGVHAPFSDLRISELEKIFKGHLA